MSEVLWQPSDTAIKQSNLTAFQSHLSRHYQQTFFINYAELHQWSVCYPEKFWQAVWDFCGVSASESASVVVDDKNKLPGAKWFAGARLNFAENLLSRRDDAPAIVFEREDGQSKTLSFSELYHQVAQVASALRREGIKAGDTVAGFLPNCPETVIAMLATASIGAIWSSCSPDFGANGVLERFGQIRPKLLFTINGYIYNGKHFSKAELIETLRKNIDSIATTVVINYLPEAADAIGHSVDWDDFIDVTASDVEFAQLPFDHPLYILYSSGTTGKPKCIVHSAGGTLLQHLKEHQLHVNLKVGEKLFYYTTCGWMMWNWLVTGLASGATIVLYDGAPFASDGRRLWDLVDRHQIAHMGLSAKYLAACDKAEIRPVQTHQLTSLKQILSTGSPLLPEQFDYVYQNVKKDVQLASISGGTDIVSCFALGNPNLPVYRGELQCLGLGMDVKVFDDAGNALFEEQGELVCTTAFPSMPIYFWDDADGARFHAAYFAEFKNVWAHGDHAIRCHDGLMILGRSDAVLNPGGVRIGTAEIYRQVEKISAVVESMAVGQQWGGDERIVLFVVLKDENKLDDALITEIKTIIRANATPRHVPAKIIQVPDIPRTLSGKIVELAVKNIIHNKPVKNKEALANPESLSLFENLDELEM